MKTSNVSPVALSLNEYVGIIQNVDDFLTTIYDYGSLRTADEKKLFIRQVEVFAAYAAYTDHEIGRVIQAVDDMGKLDNTLIIYINGDNGTSAEGGPLGTWIIVFLLVVLQMTTALRPIIIRSKVIPPTDRPITDQVSALHASQLPSKRISSVRSATGAMTRPEAANWIAAPTRRSTPPPLRFCQMVPSVMATVASAATATVTGAAAWTDEVTCGASTIVAPIKPTRIPIHCRRVTRSPSIGPASAAVRSGCRPVMRAQTAAGRPWLTDQNTPAR